MNTSSNDGTDCKRKRGSDRDFKQLQKKKKRMKVDICMHIINKTKITTEVCVNLV